MKLPSIEAHLEGCSRKLHNKTMFQSSAPDGTNHQVWRPVGKAKNQPCKFFSDLHKSLIQPYIHTCTHTHRPKKSNKRNYSKTKKMNSIS